MKKQKVLLEHISHTHDGFEEDNLGNLLREIILGGQDGVVNVLGIVLGVAIATNDVRIVLVAGLAATFAESISMAAVAYTSTRASQQYFQFKKAEEKNAITQYSAFEKEQLRQLYLQKGLSHSTIRQLISRLNKNPDKWVNTILHEELQLGESEKIDPVREAWVVGGSAIVGSLIPIAAFFFVPAFFTVGQASIAALLVSALALFVAGAITARLTIGNWIRSGLTMMAIGTLAALAGFLVGAYFGVAGV